MVIVDRVYNPAVWRSKDVRTEKGKEIWRRRSGQGKEIR